MQRRLALLVATYRYQDPGLSQLSAPGYDAEALAEVLRDPEIANFEVRTLINEPLHVVGDAIGELYHDRRGDDLTLLYFTGHGLKDDQGRLHLAMTNTTRDNLRFTGLSAQQIDDAMESCSSRQKVLVLDCCYSGAFPAGRVTKADHQVDVLDKFRGKGRVVLTASDATQYSFEGNQVIGEGTQSVFTRFLVEGLATGEADLDSDGDICLDELYSYVHDRVVEEIPQQRPKKQENVEGRIVIARNTHWTLPAHLRNGIESPYPQERRAALDILAHLYHAGNDVVRAETINHIRHLADDDSKMVAAAATVLISTLSPDPARPGVKGQDQPTKQDRPKAEKSRWVPTPVLPGPRHSSPAPDPPPPNRPPPDRPPPRMLTEGGRRRQVQVALSTLLALAATLIIAVSLATNRAQPGSLPAPEPAPAAASTTGPEVAIPAVGITIPVGKAPGFVAVSPNGHHVYIANQGTQSITVLDTAVNQVTATIPIAAGPPSFSPSRRTAADCTSPSSTISRRYT